MLYPQGEGMKWWIPGSMESGLIWSADGWVERLIHFCLLWFIYSLFSTIQIQYYMDNTSNSRLCCTPDCISVLGKYSEASVFRLCVSGSFPIKQMIPLTVCSNIYSCCWEYFWQWLTWICAALQYMLVNMWFAEILEQTRLLQAGWYFNYRTTSFYVVAFSRIPEDNSWKVAQILWREMSSSLSLCCFSEHPLQR